MSEDPTIKADRLAGKVALITGATGNIGEVLCKRFLEEGATLAMTGRSPEKLEHLREQLLSAYALPPSRILTVAMDGGEPGQVRPGVDRMASELGGIDILVNNAGSAGPRCPITQIPFTRADLEALQDEGRPEIETASDAARNIFGIAWNFVRAVTPHMKPGGTIIHVSTIFSRTHYYGRAAYVVPKAALNTFSRQLAAELGPLGIRVNTVFPGPIRSDRITRVFEAMDQLRDAQSGTTAGEFFDIMTLTRSDEQGELLKTYPTAEDVAGTIAFLASEDSAAINGHNFEVTHGMTVRQESRSTWVSRPELRTVDGTGVRVLVAAGDQVKDALTVARVQAGCSAEVLLGLGSEEGVHAAEDALGSHETDARIRPVLLDRTRPETIEAVFRDLETRNALIDGAILLPAFGAWRFRGPFSEATDADVTMFLEAELVGMMRLSQALTQFWQTHGDRLRNAPSIVFLSNASDGARNVYADVLRSATEEFCRVWRDESQEQQRMGLRRFEEWSNQIIRWGNRESEEVVFAAGQAARLLYTKRRIRQINLYLPLSIVQATGSRRALFGWMESLMGLHLGKVALITGGSAGIGGQLGRLLAIAGARIMLVARGHEQLEAMRARIVDELEDIGYYAAAERVQILSGIDVDNEASLTRSVEATVEAFGHVDYLINNAGIAGAEQMVVDMDLEDWRRTLSANLISNYSLIEKVIPIMKARGSGYILNVSSYFGGEKYIAVPYPNRADYAVSKAGQRAMVENLARFVGPEIQINAIAPGPVDGDRLRGTGGKPGLFERRSLLILENRRLNALYTAIVSACADGHRIGEVLDTMAANDTARLAGDDKAPASLRTLAERLFDAGSHPAEDASADRFLMNRPIAQRLLARLRLGGRFLGEPDGGARFDDEWILALPEPPEPFMARSAIEKQAGRIRDGVLGMLHLRNMPSEQDVALATVYFLADNAVSGETFQPSGGLHQERTITERELFGRAKPERVAQMKGETIWLIGDYMTAHLARAARLALEQSQVGRIMLLTRNEEAIQEVTELLRIVLGNDRIHGIAVGEHLEAGMDEALKLGGSPTAVVSTPFDPLPRELMGPAGEVILDAQGFKDLVESHLTHHFRVARKVSLLDDVRLVLVSPDVPVHPTHAEFALANFVKTTLHALTATLGVENERLTHNVPVNQINLTRRVRSEEPRDTREQAEEQERFARAVLLAAAPLPEADASRYRARIYRGLAITV